MHHTKRRPLISLVLRPVQVGRIPDGCHSIWESRWSSLWLMSYPHLQSYISIQVEIDGLDWWASRQSCVSLTDEVCFTWRASSKVNSSLQHEQGTASLWIITSTIGIMLVCIKGSLKVTHCSCSQIINFFLENTHIIPKPLQRVCICRIRLLGFKLCCFHHYRSRFSSQTYRMFFF